jgi:uncharacterized protein
MTDQDRDIARRFKAELEGCGVEISRLLMFGSRARGDSTEGSDLDLVIIVKRTALSVEEIIENTAWKVGFECGLVVSTVVFTEDELNHSPLRFSPFVSAVQREGIAI